MGVETWSELTDVRSVLRSTDVQDESEETEGLVSSFSSCHLSSRFMARVTSEDMREEKRDEGKDLDEVKVTYADRQLLCLDQWRPEE